MAKLTQLVLHLALCFSFAASDTFGATTPSVLKAKYEAEARGYLFDANRDEIIAKAKKEARLRHGCFPGESES